MMSMSTTAIDLDAALRKSPLKDCIVTLEQGQEILDSYCPDFPPDVQT